VEETSLLVAQGVAPMLQRLQTEVQLANQETQLIQSRTAASSARDQLLFVLGLPVDRPLTLRGTLEVPADEAPYRTVGLLNAVATALDERPDIEQARLAIELQEVNRSITRAAYLPDVSAFANYGFSGNVPDDRTVVTQTGDFEFEASSNGFFDGAYWDPSLSVGIRLNWTIFDGFQTRRRVQQNTIAIEQAEIQHEQVQEAAKLEVAQTLRELEGAEQRVNAQQQNVATANLAYDFAFERLRNGVGTQLDVRQASDNLDQSRLLQLQAIHDYLVARSDIERATGTISAVAN
jgi:outer membrane protein TolC